MLIVPDWKESLERSGDTTSGNVLLAVTPSESVTVTCTSKVPVAVGVPKISTSPGVKNRLDKPVDRLARPAGSPASVQVKGALPPEETDTLRLHGTPSVQSSKNGKIDGSLGGTPMTS